MLVHSNGSPSWNLVSDKNVASYLRESNSPGERRKLLGTELEQAILDGLDLINNVTCGPQMDIAVLAERMQDHPYIVVEEQNPGRLLGILTAFDLL